MKRTSFLFAIVIICVVGLLAFAQAQVKPPGVVILKGNPMGGVKFDHGAHMKLVADKCDTCHHASKPEKPAKAPQEKCQGCHTKTAVPPMKTSAKLAFHDAMAKAGTCINCHTKEVAAGKKAPVKCAECHKKENA